MTSLQIAYRSILRQNGRIVAHLHPSKTPLKTIALYFAFCLNILRRQAYDGQKDYKA
ncbi:hypothetical protein SC1083_0946 [Aggregatibacter actinomycetemcomitans serotype e str. SC1083]|uniref:Uncharacterized protein n=1 Tax=Aggregatibacter actinomycetemcomitans serotype e str. SC1083 TaxID=907488 RepID=G4A800_AGGAC|nr:hypothetical protein SC1083_0946 [Aggregatibacter actinomycetemcomitans serotype e str. SC1083]